MIRYLSSSAVLLTMAQPAIAAPPSSTFAYCSVPSTSPRGPGLIVTDVFPTRSGMTFVESAFTNFLRTSYAPYGNGWVFPETGVSCVNFTSRRKAEAERSLDLSRIPQPTRSIFPVTFRLG